MRTRVSANAWALALCGALFLLSVSADAQQTTTYVYDATGRLTKVTHPNNTVTTYAYDTAGNRTSVTSVANGVVAPTANPDTAEAHPINFPPYLVSNAWALIGPLANDSDPAGNPLSIASATQGAQGATFLDSPFVGYASNLTTDGTDTFTYTATNGHLASSAATVTVHRHPQATSPYALNDVVDAYPINAPPYLVLTAFAYFDPLVNDYDYNGYAVTVTAVTQGASGMVSIDQGGTRIVYMANPTTPSDDSFTYTISNGHGGTKTATVLVHRHP